jgi:hypothetical protein
MNRDLLNRFNDERRRVNGDGASSSSLSKKEVSKEKR